MLFNITKQYTPTIMKYNHSIILLALAFTVRQETKGVSI